MIKQFECFKFLCLFKQENVSIKKIFKVLIGHLSDFKIELLQKTTRVEYR